MNPALVSLDSARAISDSSLARRWASLAENSSATGASALDRQLSVLRAMVAGYEALPQRVALSTAERRALSQRLASDCFWNLGYRQLDHPGRAYEALRAMCRGIHYWPWDWRYWKVYLLARLRVALAFTRAAP